MCTLFDSQSGNQTPVYPVAEKPVVLFGPVGVCRRDFFLKGEIMKNVFLFLITVLLFSSCSMEKRLYRPGWFVQTNSKPENERKIIHVNKHPEKIQVITFSAIDKNGIEPENILPEKSELKMDSVSEKIIQIISETGIKFPYDTLNSKKASNKNRKEKYLHNPDHVLGLGRGFLSIVMLAWLVLVCILGSPFWIFLIPVGFMASVYAWSSVLRLANNILPWKITEIVFEKLEILFFYSSIGILILLFPFSLSVYFLVSFIIALMNRMDRNER